MDLEDAAEVLGEPWRESPLDGRLRALTGRWPGSWRPSRRLVVVVTAVLMVAGFVVALRVAGGPRPASVQVTSAQEAVSSPRWQPGPDGRPDGPVLFSAAATLRRGSSGAPTSVVGIAGPGVVKIWNAVTLLPEGKPVIVSLRSQLDCTAVPAVVPKGAYRLRVQVAGSAGSGSAGSGSAGSGSGSAGSGSGSAEQDQGPAGTSVSLVSAGAAGELWSTQIQLACASYWARRDLTITQLQAVVNPTSSRLDVSMTVANSTSRSETVFAGLPLGSAVAPVAAGTSTTASSATSTAASSGTSGGAAADRVVPVPPHSSRSISTPVTFDTCDAVPLAPDGSGRLATDSMFSSPLLVTGLAGRIGTDVIGAAVLGPDEQQEGYSSTSLVLAPKAGRALSIALSRACGGIGPMVTLGVPGSVRFEPRQRVLTVTLLLDVEPGRVRSIRLDSQDGAAAADSAAFRPLWTTIRHLTPDRSGQARVTLRYRAPAPSSGGQQCPSQGAYLPAFVATLTVPSAGTERIVRYTGIPDLSADLRAFFALC